MDSVPQPLPSLNELLDEVRAPGASRADVDALIAGLSRPLPEGQSPRERADLLLALIEDERLADFTGRDGRTVRGAAVQALLELGYPYALEVPPEALAAKDSVSEEEGQPVVPLLSTSNGKWGFGLLMGLGALMLLPALYMSVQADSIAALLVFLTLVSCLTFLPAGMTLLGHNMGNRVIKGIGSFWLILCSLLWLGPSIAMLGSGSLVGLLPLVTGSVSLIGTWLMNSKS